NKTNPLRAKIIGYTVILVVLTSALVANIAFRKPMDFDIIRDRNQLYRVDFNGLVENTYTLKVINKAQYEQTFNIKVQGLDNFKYIGKQTFTVQAGQSHNVPLSLVMDPYDLKAPMTEFSFVLSPVSEPDETISQPSNFFKAR
ncbi:MAG: cytochrome c oxidase accessory protein CcoG, partial [Pseudoalteromonas sp.]|nr:cytochrome c oxidase accessory protein CcoG [Pseudoalteromonas sp.]